MPNSDPRMHFMLPQRRASTAGHGRLADGSISGARLQSASVRALDSYRHVRRIAESLSDELNDITAPLGIQTADLDEEDSAVIVVSEAIATIRKD